MDIIFLKEKIVIYYAGFDYKCLPFNEGKEFVRKRINQQLTFLKCLSLVCDHIIIPPSFYFYLSYFPEYKNIIDLIIELYKAHIVISPIYYGMNNGLDFLEYKREKGSLEDKIMIGANNQILTTFFKEIPVFHRDVIKQSSQFKDYLINSLDNIKINNRIHDNLYSFIAEKQNDEIMFREAFNNRLQQLLINNKIIRSDYRKLHYAGDIAYYKQGAFMHYADISILNSERFSIFTKDIFIETPKILIGYDPNMILTILANFGIQENIIEQLSIDHLRMIRLTKVFEIFKKSYHEFAMQLQTLEIENKKLSKRKIISIQSKTLASFMTEYFKQQKKYKSFSISESVMLNILSGSISFIIPLLGFMLGRIAPLMQLSKMTIVELIVSNLARKQIAFYLFIERIKEISNVINKENLPELPIEYYYI